MEKQQTAVEWLKEIYDSCNTYEKFISNIDWEQAKEMFEEQIKKEREEAYSNGYANGQMDAFTN
jgi:flagellar biosynthesis/type III secretory pathway protein FliH